MTKNGLFVTELRLKEPDDALRQSYVFALPAVRHLDTLGKLPFTKQVTFLVGENGTGKSTLLEALALACGFNPEGGTRNFNFSSKETHSALYRCLAVTRGITRPKDGFFLRAESFYNVASEVDRLNDIVTSLPPLINSYGGRSLHRQSHGESFLSLALNRFGGNGLYVLDEPEAALSPQSQLALLAHIHQLAAAHSQFIIATHSPILMAYPDAGIYELTDSGIALTPYEQTGHYRLTKQFLDCPERMLRVLMKE
ncbi:MAG: AAA family ATPase [Acetanaerobacterium sp.]